MGAPDLLSQTTCLLQRMEGGDRDAADTVFELLYAELRSLARRAMAARSGDGTVQPTEVVHELWLKLASDPSVTAESREHFLRLASRAMRALLVDRARKQSALRRGGAFDHQRIDAALELWDEQSELTPLELDELLTRLEARDERLATVVQLRFFAGLSQAEVSTALGLTRRQVEHAWALARAWLARELQRGGDVSSRRNGDDHL